VVYVISQTLVHIILVINSYITALMDSDLAWVNGKSGR